MLAGSDAEIVSVPCSRSLLIPTILLNCGPLNASWIDGLIDTFESQACELVIMTALLDSIDTPQ